MRVLAIAPEPFFTPRGTPLSVYYRTLVLSEMGARVDLLTYGQGEDVELDGVRVLRIPRFGWLGPIPVGPSLRKLFLDNFLILWTVALLLRHRYDAVHAHEESVFFCRFLKPLFRFKLVYDMHSSLPQQLVNFRFTRSRLLIRLFEALEATCLKAADAVITISPALADYATAHMPDPGRHFLIENSLFDPVRLAGPAPGDAAGVIAGREMPENGAVIAYAGTFESYQGLDLLLAAFRIVLDARSDAFLLLIGGTASQVEGYRRLADQQALTKRCRLTGRLPQRETRELLARADVLTSPRTRGSNTPLKIYEQLASGKPLVATRILSHTQVLSDEVCFLAEPEPKPLAEALLAALGDEPARRRKVEAARALYQERYSRAVYEGKIRALLEALA